MKELSDQFKLSVRSIGEVFAVLNGIDTDFGRTLSVLFRGKRLTREAVVNAAVLYLGELDPAERRRALELAVGRLEGFLAETDEERKQSAGRTDLAASEPPRQGRVVHRDAAPQKRKGAG